MRPVRTLAVYLTAVMAGAAFIAPLVFHIVQSMPWLPDTLLDQPFHRYLHRTSLVLALIGIFPVCQRLGFTHPSEVGLVNPRRAMDKMLFGLGLGTVSAAALIGLAILMGVREVSATPELPGALKRISAIVGTAAVVAVLEETLFRGVVFAGLKKGWHWTLAMLMSSALFACLHYLGRPEPTQQVNWFTGLEMLPQLFRPLFNPAVLIPGCLNLTMVGCVLCLAAHRTGNLMLPIGLHAGWIISLKLGSWLTRPVTDAASWFCGSTRIVDGWAATLLLASLLIWLEFRLRNTEKGQIPYITRLR